MQNKKRAKPVKFGSSDLPDSKAGRDSEEKHSEEKKDPKNETAPVDKPLDEDKAEGKGAEAHFSSNPETLEITEDEDEPVNKKDSVPDEEEESVSASSETDEKDEKDLPVNKDGAFFSTPPDGFEKKKSMTTYFFLVAFVTFLLGLTFFAGIYYAVSNSGAIFPGVSSPTPTVAQEEEITPTEEPVDLKAYTIRVLNGTDTSGVAAKTRDELNAAGFDVISVGNAEKDDFVETEIAAVKKVDKAYLDKLKEVLEKSYTVGSTSVLASGEADVVITIGSASAK